MTRVKKVFYRMIMWSLVIYGFFVVAGCALQRKLLYFPHQLPTDTAVQAAHNVGFDPWTNAQDELIGWRMMSPSQARGIVLIVHGNAGWAAQRDYIARPIHETGLFDVYVLEYPGYGAREGSPKLKTWLAAVEDAMESLPKDQPVYVVSESIGTGVAAHAAKIFPKRVAGLAMMVPFNSLAEVAQNRMPILLPGLTLVDRYNPSKWLEDYRGPIQFVIAEHDEVIPPKFGRKLFTGYAGPKRMEEIPDAGHNEVAMQSAEWWTQVHDFWIQSAMGE